MEFPTTDIIRLINALLPGFIAAWIFYALTAHPIRSPFERVVQALIFTGFVNALIYPIRRLALWMGTDHCNFGAWTNEGEYFLSVVLGIFLGLVFSKLANNNKLHKMLYKWNITKKTSYASEWYSVFHETKRWVYLHLKDQRRIYAWPVQWPDSPTTGHFVLDSPEWILDDNTRVPLLLTETLLIPAKDVVMVEFEKLPEEQSEIDFVKHADAEMAMIALRKSADETKSIVVAVDTKVGEAKQSTKRRKKGAKNDR